MKAILKDAAVFPFDRGVFFLPRPHDEPTGERTQDPAVLFARTVAQENRTRSREQTFARAFASGRVSEKPQTNRRRSACSVARLAGGRLGGIYNDEGATMADLPERYKLLFIGSAHLAMATLCFVVFWPGPGRFAEWMHVEARVIETDRSIYEPRCKTLRRTYEYIVDDVPTTARGPHIQTGFASDAMCYEGPEDGAVVTVAVNPVDPTDVRSRLDEEQLRRSDRASLLVPAALTIGGATMLVIWGVGFTRRALRDSRS